MDPSQTFDPTISGPGIITSAFDLLHAATLVAAGIAVVIALLVLLRVSGRRRLILAAVAVLVAVGITAFGNMPGPAMGGVEGLPIGNELLGPASDSGLSIGVAPGQPFVFSVEISNPAPIPMTILGIVRDQQSAAFPNWQAIWISTTDSNTYDSPTAGSRIFTPVEVPPSGSVFLHFVGIADSCAAGPAGSDTFVGVGDLRIAYEVLGLRSQSNVRLNDDVEEPTRHGCGLGG
jgi:hypothetical protein